jgi:hypothetical protein
MDAAAWPLEDLGIVPMEQALQDDAPGVAELAGTGELEGIKNKHWCILCTKCLSKASAFRHRTRHALALQQECRENRDAVADHRKKLVAGYGVWPLLHLAYLVSPVICMRPRHICMSGSAGQGSPLAPVMEASAHGVHVSASKPNVLSRVALKCFCRGPVPSLQRHTQNQLITSRQHAVPRCRPLCTCQ